MPVRWLSLAGLIILSVAAGPSSSAASSGDVFTSSFLVRFKRNVDAKYAHEIANKYGYDNLGTVGSATLGYTNQATALGLDCNLLLINSVGCLSMDGARGLDWRKENNMNN